MARSPVELLIIDGDGVLVDGGDIRQVDAVIMADLGRASTEAGIAERFAGPSTGGAMPRTCGPLLKATTAAAVAEEKAPHLAVPVRAGARFERGRLVGRPGAVAA